MGRKKLPFAALLFSAESSASPWPWASCSQRPKTHSFRADALPESSEIFSPEPSELPESAAVLQGLRSDRLFFDPVYPGGGSSSSSSIMPEPAPPPEFRGGVAVAVESTDPYGDFRTSMEEMVESKGAADWEWLQEMLAWFLRANGKATHGFVVGAFLDLLVGLAASSSSSSVPTDHNPLYSSSSSSSCCSSYSFEIEQADENGNG
ncbi:hypothetical protein AXF42_Ash013832 [Apostasia shenzhenica]|uniref:Transcription repressor n=1 Tax=Apostasia shenzhenica TaxID=1088818 RepID=A0A2I0AS75_9ASPA|nr:hypothetical protein AXF42_Ash013832 [Apostasia shenzhenica]